eukprot:5819525-Amphidinium_carterae.1
MALWQTLAGLSAELHDSEEENTHNGQPSSSCGQKRKRDDDDVAVSRFPWVPAVKSIFQPMYNAVKQKATINILTACSGTGCPTWALKDMYLQLSERTERETIMDTWYRF